MCRWLAGVAVVLAVSCAHKGPKSTPLSGVYVGPPSGAQVDILFYGMVAFVPQGQAMDAVFLNPGGVMAHDPLLAIDVADLPNKSVSDPEFIVPDPRGHGVGMWKFTELGFDNLDGALKQHDEPLDQPGDDLYTRIGWVPTMNEIFGTDQMIKADNFSKAAAKASLTSGMLYSTFISEPNQQELWTIGVRKDKAVADGVRLRVTLKDPGKFLVLNLDGNRRVLVKGGSTLVVGALPKTPPKRDESMLHFKHFYWLRELGPGGPDPEGPGGPSAFPARCTPVKFP